MKEVPAWRRIPWPPLIYLAAIAASIVLELLIPLPRITGPFGNVLYAIGWLLIVAFVALWLTSFRAMRRAGTTLDPFGEPSHLLTEGPFSITRNPIYLANTLLMFGVGFVSGNWWFLPLAIMAAVLTQKIAIEFEEKVLAGKFGRRYRDYSKKVRRWV
ncbi:methyltransferase family protein [Aquamicrobium ahrensii]|uniref:Protein-S-isoprenylcysteine O-methyltransferase Ste14 n=1 Tax=Aquamicrobium ahrensii TaxID=469551 RepID=A0ABV2KGS3_9HYPH